MADVVDTLIVELKAETKQLRTGLSNVEKQLGRTNKAVGSTLVGFRGLGKVFAVLGIGKMVQSTVSTARTFEDLEATLRAVTGSAANASKAFDVVTEFTKTTPFQLANVTESFIKFYQAGITPTGETLTAFGNLAAGMGKDITQLAQATFNATTGEMEMLKQFGIVARLEGDKVRMTFEGQTTVIDRTGKAIGDFIENLGATRFPTALDERLNTLSGSFSNLGDKASLFMNDIGEAGLTKELRQLSDLFQDLIGSAGEGGLADALGFVLGGAVAILRVAVEKLDQAFKFVKDKIDAVNLALMNLDKTILETVLSFQKSFNESLFGNLFQVDEQATIAELNAIKERILKATGGGEIIPKGGGEGGGDGEDEGSIVPPSAEDGAEKVDRLAESFKELQPIIAEATNQFSTDFVDSLMEGGKAIDSFKNLFKDMAKQIIASAMQMMVIKPIMDAIFGAIGLPVMSGGGKAGGGTVQANVPVVVGERGPEVFVPNTGGTVMNNMNSKNAMGGQPIVVNQSVNFATGVVGTVRAEVTKMMPQIADVTKGAVAEAAMRGGNYRKALQGG